jgi:hypothetical protein
MLRKPRQTAAGPKRGVVEGAPCDVLLCASSGGHLLEMLLLRDAWAGYERVWAVGGVREVQPLLAGERVVFGYGPGTRNVRAFVRNFVIGWRIMRRLRPKVVITTGAAVAVAVSWAARLRGARIVYIETLTRLHKPSLTYRFVAPIADRVYVQWPELARLWRARYAGNIIGAELKS